MQSEETERALMNYSNDVVNGINEVAQLFRAIMENQMSAQENLKQNLIVLETGLDGELEKSFKFINNHFTQERTDTFNAVQKLSDILYFHMDFCQEKINNLNNIIK